MPQRKRESEARDVGDAEAAAVHTGDAEAVADAGVRPDDRPISQDARCLPYIADRLASAASYATFAAAAGVDILNGESIPRFAALNKLDQSALRYKALEQRQQLLENHFQERQRRLPR